jgi:hypothetical protein
MSEAVARLSRICAAYEADLNLHSADKAWLGGVFNTWKNGGTFEAAAGADQRLRQQWATFDASTFLFDAYPKASCAWLAAEISKYHRGEFRIHRNKHTTPTTGDRANWHRFLILNRGKAPCKKTFERWKAEATSAPLTMSLGPGLGSNHGNKANTRPDVPAQRSRGVRKAAAQNP